MSTPSSDDAALTIYYDASCPLCATEMRSLQRLGGEMRLKLLDCSLADFDEGEIRAAGFTRAELMRSIHARDGNGHWLRGVEVFERAYRAVGIQSVARVLGSRRLRPMLDRVYPWIARNRMLLSRLRLNAAFGWLIAVAARRSDRRAHTCGSGRCNSPSTRY